MSVPEAAGPAIVAQGGRANLRDLQGLLERRGIHSQMVQAPKEKQSG